MSRFGHSRVRLRLAVAAAPVAQIALLAELARRRPAGIDTSSVRAANGDELLVVVAWAVAVAVVLWLLLVTVVCAASCHLVAPARGVPFGRALPPGAGRPAPYRRGRVRDDRSAHAHGHRLCRGRVRTAGPGARGRPRWRFRCRRARGTHSGRACSPTPRRRRPRRRRQRNSQLPYPLLRRSRPSRLPAAPTSWSWVTTSGPSRDPSSRRRGRPSTSAASRATGARSSTTTARRCAREIPASSTRVSSSPCLLFPPLPTGDH